MSGNSPEFFELVDPGERRARRTAKYVAILGVIAVVVLLVIGLAVGLSRNSSSGEASKFGVVDEDKRIDCYPEASSPQENLDQGKCEARGCIYSPSTTDPSAPACFWPPDGADIGLKVLTQEDIQGGKRWKLQIKPGSRPYKSDITLLTFTVQELSNNILRLTFEDAEDTGRYQVPLEMHLPEGRAENSRYIYRVHHDPFSIQILRRDTNVILWDTSVGGLIFTDQFLQISTLLPSKNIYGFGENVHQTFRHNINFTTWPLFARDEFPDQNGRNFYGVHPFYEIIEDDGNAHGVFLLNSNAMEYAFTPAPMLTYRTIGGILDFYMMMGPSPENVIQQYTSMVGRPYMPPYWALGFQLCRYGYKNTSDIKAAVERTLNYDIPLDVQYADIDYMDHERIFTIDQENFGDLPEYFRDIQARGIRNIIILDPCIEINDTYEPYIKGKAKDIFIKWSNRSVMPSGDYEEYNNTDMMGYVWPNWKVVFPDFFDARAEDVWTELVVDFSRMINFDGIWIDMNEPANFGTNDEMAWNWDHGKPYWTLKCPSSTWDDPPYRPKAAYIYDTESRRARLSDKTLCMQGVQSNGTLLHYDVHNLYGLSQSKVTLRSMRKALVDKRGQVVTRSTYPGSGAVSGHWLGDNASSWAHLRLSIIGLLEFNLFGIPYIGADICGFFGNPTPELCLRWMQLGAFYTFARNHNHKDSEHQDPGYYGEEVAVASREALETRYRLLPYLYTLFHKAHVQGDTVIRPLFHEFPTDEKALGVDHQFLWGPALLISPILEEKQTSLTLYLPDGRWYNYYNGRLDSDTAGMLILPVLADTPITLHLRGGYIIPVQRPANNTFYSRQNAFGLLVALDSEDGVAGGQLFWDDGESIDTFENGNYFSAIFTCKNNTLRTQIQHDNYTFDKKDDLLEDISVMGVSATNHVFVNGIEHMSFNFSHENKVLNITSLGIPVASAFTINWE